MSGLNVTDREIMNFNMLQEAFAYFEIKNQCDTEKIIFCITFCNKAFIKMTGIKKNDVIGKNVDNVLPNFKTALIKLYDKLKNEDEKTYKINILLIDNKYYSISGLIDKKGRIAVIFNDNTNIVLEIEKENIYKHLFDNSQDIILFLDEKGRIINANQTALIIYGYKFEEILGLNITDIRAEDTLKEFNKQFYQAKDSGTYFETKHIKKDGTIFPVEVSSKSSKVSGEIIVMSIIHNISQRKEMEKELFHLANYDYLTNIPNRAYMMNNFGKFSTSSLRDNYRLALIYFDVDKFKSINDNYGHEIGDRVLIELVDRIKYNITKVDMFARVGGDEFILIQSQVKTVNEVINKAEKIVDAFKTPFKIGDFTIPIAISIGIAIYPDDSNNMEDIMVYADNAMYSAKEKKGSNYVFYNFVK